MQPTNEGKKQKQRLELLQQTHALFAQLTFAQTAATGGCPPKLTKAILGPKRILAPNLVAARQHE